MRKTAQKKRYDPRRVLLGSHHPHLMKLPTTVRCLLNTDNLSLVTVELSTERNKELLIKAPKAMMVVGVDYDKEPAVRVIPKKEQ